MQKISPCYALFFPSLFWFVWNQKEIEGSNSPHFIYMWDIIRVRAKVASFFLPCSVVASSDFHQKHWTSPWIVCWIYLVIYTYLCSTTTWYSSWCVYSLWAILQTTMQIYMVSSSWFISIDETSVCYQKCTWSGWIYELTVLLCLCRCEPIPLITMLVKSWEEIFNPSCSSC